MYRFSVLIEFAFGDGDGLAAYPAIESPICHDVALLSDGVSAQETRPLGWTAIRCVRVILAGGSSGFSTF